MHSCDLSKSIPKDLSIATVWYVFHFECSIANFVLFVQKLFYRNKRTLPYVTKQNLLL